jgi:probable F420-dependent oxidoreductase
MVKLGTGLPEHLIGTDHGAFKEFLLGAEQLGYNYVTMGDHILGADVSVRPDWRPYQGKPPLFDHRNPWLEPLVMWGYMAALTTKIEFGTGILVAPQRQAALLAKQAAQADILSGGRVWFVLSAGWNDVEYEGLGINFADRGKILEEQMILMRQLWTQDVVTYHGKFHTLNAVGINPLPIQRPIPLWMGGQSKPAMRRVGQLADGWYPSYPFFELDKMYEDLATVHEFARGVGRDPASIGIVGTVFFEDTRFERPAGAKRRPDTLEECAEYAQWWKKFGATKYTVSCPWAKMSPEDIVNKTAGGNAGVEQHLRALEEFKIAVGPDF